MKIPRPQKRGKAYRIEFMFEGVRYSCTRDTVRECERWYAVKMLELKTGKQQERQEQSNLTFKGLFSIYYEKIGKHKASYKSIKSVLNSLDRTAGNLGVKMIEDITPKDLTDWRNKRLREVSAGTVLKEISIYSSIFSFAQKELFIIQHNPFLSISKPKTPKARNRRVSDDDIELIKKHFNYQEIITPINTKQYVAWAVMFAIETAMRRGEILAINKRDIHDNHLHIPHSKNGTTRDIPLTAKAKELLNVLEFKDDKAFPCSANAFRIAWEKGKKDIGLADLHFHDTRHEAITRMVRDKHLPVHILAKITGHKEIAILVNTYYNPSANEIVDMFNK